MLESLPRGSLMVHAIACSRVLLGTWAAASAIIAYLMTVEDAASPWTHALSADVWAAAIIGCAVASLFIPLLTAPWMRWYWGAIVGIPVGLTIVFTFFFVQPHAWQPTRLDAWKSVALFVEVYPQLIFPACMAAGAFSAQFKRERTIDTG